METIMNVVKSLVEMNGWEVQVFNIQRIQRLHNGEVSSYYVGYLDCVQNRYRYVIDENGTFTKNGENPYYEL